MMLDPRAFLAAAFFFLLAMVAIGCMTGPFTHHDVHASASVLSAFLTALFLASSAW